MFRVSPRVRMVSALVVASAVAAGSPSANAWDNDADNCDQPSILVAGTHPSFGMFPMQYRSDGEVLAYDFLLRSQPSAPRWSEAEYTDLGARIERALSPLRTLLSYEEIHRAIPLVPFGVNVDFDESFRNAMVAVAPAPEIHRVWSLPSKMAFPDDFERFCEQVCGCWLNPDKRTGTLKTYVSFARRANRLLALRELRKLSVVLHADFENERRRYLLPYESARSVPADTLVVRPVPDSFYFTMTKFDDAGAATKRFFVVRGDSVSELTSEDVARISEFEPPPLPELSSSASRP